MAARGADESPGVWRRLDGMERATLPSFSMIRRAPGADESPGVWRRLDGMERADIVLLSGHAPPVRRRARPGRRRVSKARVLCARAAGSRGGEGGSDNLAFFSNVSHESR